MNDKNIPFEIGENFDMIVKSQLRKPEIAILELISNSWDAGANNVEISWPIFEGLIEKDSEFIIKDDGSGMSSDEFLEKWKFIGYNKGIDEKDIILANGIKRNVIGRNGRGRLGLFSFSDNYIVSTCKNGIVSSFKITRDKNHFANIVQLNQIKEPFTKNSKLQDGTYIKCPIKDNYRTVDILKDTISVRFGADSSFNIYLNNEKIDLFDFKDNFESHELYYNNEVINIYKIPKDQYNKRLSTYQLVWWVKNRYVEYDNWKDININLSSNNTNENKFLFLVCADFLEDKIKSDWTGFEDSDLVNEVKSLVSTEINKIMDNVITTTRLNEKKSLINESMEDIVKLNPIGRSEIGKYIDEIMDNCKSINHEDFVNLIKILAKMEDSSKKFSFFKHIAEVSPKDLDKLTEIVEKWSIEDAYIVLDELYNRLELLNKIDSLVYNPKTLEVQQLQPLFKEGLWIFHPRFEGKTRFTSNQTFNKVFIDLLGISEYNSENSKHRPDFVVLTDDSTLGTFTSDHYDDDGATVDYYDEILIIELKKGNSEIGYDEKEQAFRYAKEIQKHGDLNSKTKITAYVLGTRIESGEMEKRTEGNITVYPRQYNLIVETAKNRTFGLINKIKNVKGITDIGDKEINEVLGNNNQLTLDDIT